MSSPIVPTSARVTYTLGYLALGMIKEAVEELQAVPASDQDSLPVMKAWIEIHMGAKSWELVIATAQPMTQAEPAYEPAWIAWAFALRELQRTQEAKDVLLDAFPLHGKTSGVLHYNLACYECLLGNMSEARRYLTQACKIDKSWKDAARDDPDLKELARM